MLKNISPLISPELLKVLAEMGHGQAIVLGDANYPAYNGCAPHILRADGVGIPALLDAILKLFPLDSFVAKPVTRMEVVPGDPYVPVIWDEYRSILSRHGFEACDEGIERFAFYERAKGAYCVVATGESARYANLILQKGVLEPGEN